MDDGHFGWKPSEIPKDICFVIYPACAIGCVSKADKEKLIRWFRSNMAGIVRHTDEKFSVKWFNYGLKPSTLNLMILREIF